MFRIRRHSMPTSPIVEALTEINQPKASSVAQVLRDAGIKGVRWDGVDCPLARWFRQQLPGRIITVGGFTVRVDGTAYELPQSAINFRHGFDTGQADQDLEDTNA